MIDSNSKSKLENLKQLFDSKLISEAEYHVLKEEILFNTDANNKNFEKENISTISNNHTNNEKSYVNNEQNSKEKNTLVYIIIGFFIIGLWFWNSKNNSSDNNSNTVDETLNTISTTDENISETSSTVCKICSREFTGDGYDKIDGQWQRNKDIQTELCSASCAIKEEENIDEKYDKILKKYEHKSSGKSLMNSNNGYQVGEDGRIYEGNPCTLCNGTGIEKNTARNLSGGDYGRICPMCEGKGLRSY